MVSPTIHVNFLHGMTLFLINFNQLADMEKLPFPSHCLQFINFDVELEVERRLVPHALSVLIKTSQRGVCQTSIGINFKHISELHSMEVFQMLKITSIPSAFILLPIFPSGYIYITYFRTTNVFPLFSRGFFPKISIFSAIS